MHAWNYKIIILVSAFVLLPVVSSCTSSSSIQQLPTQTLLQDHAPGLAQAPMARQAMRDGNQLYLRYQHLNFDYSVAATLSEQGLPATSIIPEIIICEGPINSACTGVVADRDEAAGSQCLVIGGFHEITF